MTGAEHGYLLSNLLGVPGLVLFFWLAGRFRRSLLLAGMIELLHVPPLIWFQNVYWSPNRLGGLALGIEDILVSFAIGVGAWFCAIWPWRARLRLQIEAGVVVRRLLIVALPSTLFAIGVWLLGSGVMPVLLYTMAATLLALGWHDRRHLRLSATAVLLYTPYYTAILWLTEALFPGFFTIWDGPQLWGVDLWGLPLEELAFVVAYSAVWPMILGFAFRAEVTPR